MTVVAFVGTRADAQLVVTWAGRFAAAQNAELVVFYVPTASGDQGLSVDTVGDNQFGDETYAAVVRHVEGIVRSKRARKGRIPRHAVSLRGVSAADPVAETISRVRVESPDLFVAAAVESPQQTNGKSVVQQIVARLFCDVVTLFGHGARVSTPKQMVVAVSDGTHDRSAVDLAGRVADILADGVTIVGADVSVGEGALQVGERQLRSLLRDIELEESPHVKIKAVLTENWDQAIAEAADGSDLLLIGANVEKRIPALLAAQPDVTVGVFRRAARLSFHRNRKHAAWLLPQLNPTDYINLYEQLQSGSRWNSDFSVMLALAAGIATLGLLQNSPAVVIGSMLLAPLMTPMIGMGLALNQGNAKLAQSSSRAMGLRAFTADVPRRFWVRHVVAGLTVCVVAITIPLVMTFMRQVREGRSAPLALALTNEMREILLDHVSKKPGVEMIFAGRSGVDRESDPVDIAVILSAQHPLPRREADALIELVRTSMQNPELRVKVACVAQGWANEPTGGLPARTAGDLPD